MIPDEIRAGWDARAAGAKAEQAWRERLAAYAGAYPELAAELERRLQGELPAGWREAVAQFARAAQEKPAALATRSASQKVLNVLGATIPELLGGSADLTGSNNTNHKGSKAVTGGDIAGNYLHYGVREFGMTAIMNGVALHGGFVPYGGTFLVFSGLRAQRGAHGGADEAARDLRVHARLDRPRRRRADPPADRARCEPAPDSRHARLASLRHGRDGCRLGRRRRATPTARPA